MVAPGGTGLELVGIRFSERNRSERILWQHIKDTHSNPLQQIQTQQGGRTMLVLARKCGESIMVGDDVRISVVRVKGNRVKLTIEAPREISVERGERLETEPLGDAPLLPETCDRP